VTVIRPADANETVEAWKVAIQRRDGPTALALTRQAVPTLDRSLADAASELAKGAYVLSDFGEGEPELILMASGSEVSLIYDAAARLAAEGIAVRAVSFPSWELFEEQDEAYREAVLPKDIRKRLAVEAGAGLGWDRYVGSEGSILSLERFGASAPGKVIFEKLGFTVENVIARAREVLKLA
jgi:transketolase